SDLRRECLGRGSVVISVPICPEGSLGLSPSLIWESAFPTPPKIGRCSNYLRTNLGDAGRWVRSLCNTPGNPESSACIGGPPVGAPTPTDPVDIAPSPVG